MLTRPLDLDDIEHYLEFFVVQNSESGADGDAYYGPYGRDEPFVIDEVRERTRERWTKSLGTPGWRRAWGSFDGDRLVGSANLAGDDLAAGLHRVTLGMGILHGYRRQGIGTRLLDRPSNGVAANLRSSGSIWVSSATTCRPRPCIERAASRRSERPRIAGASMVTGSVKSR